MLDFDDESVVFLPRLRISSPTIQRNVPAWDSLGSSGLFATPDGAVLPELPARLPWPGPRTPTKKVKARRGHRWDLKGVFWSPLHAAAANGHLQIIELLLDNGFEINAPSYAYCWCQRIRTYATDAGFPSPKAPDEIWERVSPFETPYGQRPLWTPLHHAICHGQYEAAKMLLCRGAAVSLEIVLTRQLVRRHDLDHIKDPKRTNSVTALHLAAGLGNLDLVKFIVESGFQTNLEIEDDQCLTPVFWAFKNGHYSTTVPWLLSRGADINFTPKDCAQNGLLFSSIDYGHYEQASRLLDLGARPARQKLLAVDITLLHLACCGAIQLGPIDLSTSRHGFQPYHKTVREDTLHSRLEQYSNHTEKQRVRLIKKLLSTGAVLDSPSWGNYTPLELAVKHHLISTAECLPASGAKIRASSFVRTIIDCFATFEECPSRWWTPVMDMFQLLIAHGVEGMSRPEMLGTCLHIMLSKHPRDSRLDSYSPSYLPAKPHADLLEREARAKGRDITRDIVQFLLRRDADPGFCDLSDYTAFQHACDKGAFSAVKAMMMSGYRPSSWEISGIVLQSMENDGVAALRFALGLQPEIFNKVTFQGKCLLSLLRRQPDCIRETLDCLTEADLRFSSKLHWGSNSELLETLGWACIKPHVPIMKGLIRSVATANLATKPAIMSRLLGAVIWRRPTTSHRFGPNTLRVAKLLLEAGADALMSINFKHVVSPQTPCEPKTVNFVPISAIGIAIDLNDFEVVDIILNHCPQIFRPCPKLVHLELLHLAVREMPFGDDWEGLESTVRAGHVITQLVHHGADLSATDTHGCSPLAYLMQMCAGSSRHCEVDIPGDAAELFPRLIRLLWYEKVDVSAHSNDCDSIQESSQKLEGNGAEVQSAEDGSLYSSAPPTVGGRRALADAVAKTVRIVEREDGKKVLELLPDEGH